MKKAYVKPVFLAEEFVAETSYANQVCNVNQRGPLEIVNGDYWCKDHSKANGTGGCHAKVDISVGSNPNGQGAKSLGLASKYNPDKSITYWDYARYNSQQNDYSDGAYLFTDANTVCDFLWDGNTDSNVYAYDSVEKQSKENWSTFALTLLNRFFFGDSGQFNIGYEGQPMQSI